MTTPTTRGSHLPDAANVAVARFPSITRLRFHGAAVVTRAKPSLEGRRTEGEPASRNSARCLRRDRGCDL
jgi:hypothetical protein